MTVASAGSQCLTPSIHYLRRPGRFRSRNVALAECDHRMTAGVEWTVDRPCRVATPAVRTATPLAVYLVLAASYFVILTGFGPRMRV